MRNKDRLKVVCCMLLVGLIVAIYEVQATKYYKGWEGWCKCIRVG